MKPVTSLFLCPGQTQSRETGEYFVNSGLEMQPTGLEQVRGCKKVLKDTLNKLLEPGQPLLVVVGPTTELFGTYHVMFDDLFPVHARHEFREREDLRPLMYTIAQDLGSGKPFPNTPQSLETEKGAIQRITSVRQYMEAEAADIGASVIIYIVNRHTMRILAINSIGYPVARISCIPQPGYAELWQAKDGILEPVQYGCPINQTQPEQKEAFSFGRIKAPSSLSNNRLGLETPAPRPSQEAVPISP